jgi:hypothetical protein
MTSYDPFARGAFPVGVRSEEWYDAARDRTLAKAQSAAAFIGTPPRRRGIGGQCYAMLQQECKHVASAEGEMPAASASSAVRVAIAGALKSIGEAP